jgi:hypothetical protein
MADLVIGTVEVGSALTRSDLDVKQVSEAVSIGEVLYLNSADSKYALADADAEASAEATHIALSAASADGDYVVVMKLDSSVALQINLGAALTVGTTYVVSATAGAIAPESDLLQGDYVTHLGVATTASLLDIKLNVTGVAKP